MIRFAEVFPDAKIVSALRTQLYFYDKPREMIAGEVPAPAVSLGNRDVIARHLSAIAFGAATPGLAGKMMEYVAPNGTVNQEAVSALIEAVRAQTGHALAVAREVWGADVLAKAELDEARLLAYLQALPGRIQHVVGPIARLGRSRICGSRWSSSPRGSNASSPRCGPATWSPSAYGYRPYCLECRSVFSRSLGCGFAGRTPTSLCVI